MKILREYLGGKEEIDLATIEGQLNFVMDVVQDQETAAHYIERFKHEDEIIVNEIEPLYIERWTVIA